MPNISRSKGHPTVKFGQLIHYSVRNVFLKNHTQNVIEKLFADPFLKNQNWVHLWISSLKFYTVCFYMWQVEGYLKILKLSRKPLAFTSYKVFLKYKKRSGTSLTASFTAGLFLKNTSHVIIYYLTRFHCLVAFTSRDIGQYCKCRCKTLLFENVNIRSRDILHIDESKY